MPNDHKDIQQQERDLFASMAKVHQPLVPDSVQMPFDGWSSQDFVEARRAEMRARFPSFTDAELDSEMF